MKPLTAIAAVLLLTSSADACHKFSIWNYPYRQHCGIVRAQAIIAPNPPPKPLLYYADRSPDVDIPLPSLEGMEFPPDCLAEWCQRLKGIGLLREKLGTN